MRDISALAHEAGAWVHADAVQMLGKSLVDVADVGLDFLSLSGHKMHAPKGIGALFVSRRVSFHPLLVGGGQERGLRSGTENVPGIVALGKAAETAYLSFQDENPLIILRDLFEHLLQEVLPEIHIHGHEAPRLPNTSSICFPGVDAAALIIRLDQKGVACSGGSACHTGTLHPSHVLEAMSYDARHAASTLRFSLSRFNTKEEIQKAAQIIIAAVHHLREQWDPNVIVTFS
jgi:cysteine desulfurase